MILRINHGKKYPWLWITSAVALFIVESGDRHKGGGTAKRREKKENEMKFFQNLIFSYA